MKKGVRRERKQKRGKRRAKERQREKETHTVAANSTASLVIGGLFGT